MQDLAGMAMLVCAAVAALFFGVLLAYAFCRGAFAVLKAHARSVANGRVAKATAAVQA